MYTPLQVNYLLFLSCFHENRSSKTPDINFHESVQWEPSCSMRTDGRTERNDEANNHCPRFRSRADTLKLRIDTTPWRRIRGVGIKVHTYSSSVNSHSRSVTYSHYQGGCWVPPSTWTHWQKGTFLLRSRIEPPSHIPLMVIR